MTKRITLTKYRAICKLTVCDFVLLSVSLAQYLMRDHISAVSDEESGGSVPLITGFSVPSVVPKLNFPVMMWEIFLGNCCLSVNFSALLLYFPVVS